MVAFPLTQFNLTLFVASSCCLQFTYKMLSFYLCVCIDVFSMFFTVLYCLCSSLARLPRSRPVSGAEPCGHLRGLTPGQVGVCRARGEVMESVRKAAEMVIEEVREAQ